MKAAKLLAFVAVMGMVSVAMAQDAPKKKRKHRSGIRGKIVRVEGTNVIISTRTRGTKETEEVTVATDDDTAIRVDKKKATLADLKPDMWIFVTPKTGTATKIYASTTKPERKRRPRKDRPAKPE